MMIRFLYFTFLLIILGCCSKTSVPRGDYLGLLKFSAITYHIYLKMGEQKPIVINTTFKGEEFNLDTIYFQNDSLHFRISDFYSEYRGHYDRHTNTISGQWIGEDSTLYPLKFFPANADTISGLHPRITSDYQYKQPVDSADGIKTCSLSDQQIDPAVLDTIMNRIITDKYESIHSLLIARNSCLVAEEYFYRYDREFVYNIQSATKSVVSALTGIAIGKGELKGVKETLCAHLPGYKKLACNEQNKTILLRDLLTMSTGIPWDEQTYDYMDSRNSLAIGSNERDQFVYLLSLPRKQGNAPFAYNSLNHTLMNAVLRQATGLENKMELTERLLKPLGIEHTYLGEVNPMGVIGDIGLRPRDMMKFGLLYLQGGKWNDKQLIPADWVRESTRPHVYPGPSLGYGYFWWTRDFKWKNKNVSSFFAWGYGGQYIFVIPEAKLTIVLSGSRWTTDPEGPAMEIVQQLLDNTK